MKPGLKRRIVASVGPFMSASPSGSNLFDLPEFSEEEEHTGIHVRPTPSMPADDAASASTIMALLAEATAEATIEDLTEAAEAETYQDDAVTLVERVSPAPAVAAPPSAPSRQAARFGLIAFTIAAFGFGVGFFFTRPTGSPATPSKDDAPPMVVSVPTVSIAQAAAGAPMTASAVVPTSPPEPPPTLADGDGMLRAGNLARAEQIYQSVLSSGGSDHAALTGLGKVALRRGQNGEAITFFERALARQPQYFPARLGVADALWNSGRADAAKARYAALRERYADNMIPPRIVERTR